MSAQLSLFAKSAPEPQGLRYQPEFISADAERELIARIRTLPLVPFQFGAFEGKRRVASFGWRYDYDHQRIEKADAFPPWIVPLIARVETWAELDPVQQVLFTEYDVGVGIGWHRDKRQYDQVAGISLGAACKFRLRRKAGTRWERFTLDAQPRSIYLMAGESRQVWEHSIPPVEAARYSITFRTMVRARDGD